MVNCRVIVYMQRFGKRTPVQIDEISITEENDSDPGPDYVYEKRAEAMRQQLVNKGYEMDMYETSQASGNDYLYDITVK